MLVSCLSPVAFVSGLCNNSKNLGSSDAKFVFKFGKAQLQDAIALQHRQHDTWFTRRALADLAALAALATHAALVALAALSFDGCVSRHGCNLSAT